MFKDKLELVKKLEKQIKDLKKLLNLVKDNKPELLLRVPDHEYNPYTGAIFEENWLEYELPGSELNTVVMQTLIEQAQELLKTKENDLEELLNS